MNSRNELSSTSRNAGPPRSGLSSPFSETDFPSLASSISHTDTDSPYSVQQQRNTAQDSVSAEGASSRVTGQTFNFEALKSERVRLNTFTNSSVPSGAWPKSFIKPEDLAKAGFFYLGDSDKVQCTFCHGVVGEWEVGDVPLTEHKQHFPRCPFVCKLPVGNIQLGQEAEAAVIRELEHEAIARVGVDVCGPFEPVLRPYAGPDQGLGVRGAQPLRGDMDEVTGSLAIRTGSGPARKHLVTEQSRLETFTGDWPLSGRIQSPEAMTEAGFYYIGISDHVKCFYCDGGLRNWEPADDPWIEHARWFSQCPFVLLNKGNQFIQDVLKSKPPVVQKEEAVPPRQPQCSEESQRRSRQVTDDEIRSLVETPMVQDVLAMGMDIGNVKAALRLKLQQTGTPFTSTQALVEATLAHDHDQEYYGDFDDDSSEEEEEPPREQSNPSASAVLAARLSSSIQPTQEHVLSSQESSGSSARRSSSESGSDEDAGTSKSGKTCSSPSADSGKYSMNVSSGEEDDQSRKLSDDVRNAAGSMVDYTARQLEEEVRQLKEARQCKICMDKEAEVVFLPCGHLISCVRCATALSDCALCRQPIKAVVRTYLA